jgi:transposase
MEKIVNQCAGIDCAKKDFTVTMSVCDSLREIKYLSSRTFNNDPAGFKAFDKWAGKLYNKSLPMLFLMEATGVYHQKLAYFLKDLTYNVAIVVPKRAKDFSKTLKVKKINDKISSQYLSVMGLEKKIELWSKPDPCCAELRHLTREKEQIQQHIIMLKNQMEAAKSGISVFKSTIKRLNDTLKILTRQKAQVLNEIKHIIHANSQLKEKVDKITSIPGVGYLTAATIIGETDGFSLVKNKRQLVSYAGYDVMSQESGSSIHTKPHISKKGNRNIRKAMHMPALTSIRHDPNSKATFVRLVSKTGIKMKGVVAIQRKLLVLIYTLWKNNTSYEPDYEIKKGSTRLPHELDQVRSSESLTLIQK